MCPVCLEKVDLRHLWADRPWETRNISWCQALASALLHATVTGSKDAQPCCRQIQLSAVQFDGSTTVSAVLVLQDTDAGCAAVHVLLVSAAARW